MKTKEEKNAYMREYNKRYRKDNLEYHKGDAVRAKKYRDKRKQFLRSSRLKADYGITLTEYESMLACQDGKCKICGKHYSEFKKSFAVDHDHITGEIRALLCMKCNLGIANFNEDINIMNRAIKYIEHFKEIRNVK